MSVRSLPANARRSLALLAFCAMPPLCAAESIARQTQRLPDIAAPAGGDAAWIARAMRLNGVPMTIKSFKSPTNADEVLHQYEHRLRTSSDMKMRRAQEGAWQVLAVMTDDFYATIRARNTARGSEGTVTVTPPLSGMKPMKHTRFPHPDSAAVVSLQEYDDAGIEAEHISFASRRSVAIEAQAFAARLSEHGWQVLRNEPAQRRQGHVIEAQKAAELAFVNLRRAESGGATILVVWRKG
jgi:hypothetical protein